MVCQILSAVNGNRAFRGCGPAPSGRVVIPAGLPDAQRLMLLEKQTDGRVTTKEILPVRFSQLEDTEGPSTRAGAG